MLKLFPIALLAACLAPEPEPIPVRGGALPAAEASTTQGACYCRFTPACSDICPDDFYLSGNPILNTACPADFYLSGNPVCYCDTGETFRRVCGLDGEFESCTCAM
jgi:hypothetical protein